MKAKFAPLLAGVALVGMSTAGAKADLISIGLQENGYFGNAIVTEATGSGSSGVLNLSFGTFAINFISATDFAVLGMPDVLNTNTQDVQLAQIPAPTKACPNCTKNNPGGTLRVYVTVQGVTFGGLGKKQFESDFAVNNVTKGWKVTEQTLVSGGNILYGGTPLSNESFSTLGSDSLFSLSPIIGNPFSVTELYTIAATKGAGNDNSTIDVSAVPEPSTWAMMLMGFVGLGFAAHRRMKKNGAALAAA